MNINLTSPDQREVKQFSTSFNWIAILFWGFIPLFKKHFNILTRLIILIGWMMIWGGLPSNQDSIAYKLLTSFSFILGILFCIFYNNFVIKDFLKNGWTPTDKIDEQILEDLKLKN